MEFNTKEDKQHGEELEGLAVINIKAHERLPGKHSEAQEGLLLRIICFQGYGISYKLK
jgi:hypothetical protein